MTMEKLSYAHFMKELLLKQGVRENDILLFCGQYVPSLQYDHPNVHILPTELDSLQKDSKIFIRVKRGSQAFIFGC
jgi:hypothetical protein